VWLYNGSFITGKPEKNQFIFKMALPVPGMGCHILIKFGCM
jgi:hypothetical protein